MVVGVLVVGCVCLLIPLRAGWWCGVRFVVGSGSFDRYIRDGDNNYTFVAMRPVVVLAVRVLILTVISVVIVQC